MTFRITSLAALVLTLSLILFAAPAPAQTVESVPLNLTGQFESVSLPVGSEILNVGAVGQAPDQTLALFYQSSGAGEMENRRILVIPKEQQRPRNDGFRSVRLGCFDFDGLDAYGYQYTGQLCAYEYIRR